MELKEFFCKCCTAPLDPGKAVGRVIRCEHCGTYFTMAKESEPKVQNFLNQAEHDLDTCNFEGAYAAYQKAAELDKEEPEAYFGMALAKFKVQYLKDETSDPPRLQPICHEISEKSFSADKHYLRALELASKEQKRVYREKASEIDEIRDQFNELKEDGVKYDCFLCVKVSDENGGTTQDSHEALRLYHHLKERGFHPFYSEEEIGSRTGSDYEALILYALYTSECMLLVCYNEEYLQTKWVKNEYTRFMAMIANEDKERDAITFVFKGKPVERLPGKSGKIQGIDLSRPDAYTRIDNFVESHTPEARAQREAEKARKRQEEDAMKRQLDAVTKLLEESERRRKEEEEARKKQEEENRLAAQKRAEEEAERRRAEEEARNREREEMRELYAQMKREREAAASAPTTPAAPTASAAPAANAQPQTAAYSVVLKDIGYSKLGVITAMRRLNEQLSLAEAKGLVERMGVMLENLTPEAAKNACEDLQKAGATVEIVPPLVEPQKAAAESPAQPDVLYSVELKDAGKNKIAVIKAVRELNDLGLVEAKKLVEELGVIKENVTLQEATSACELLKKAGAKAEIVPMAKSATASAAASAIRQAAEAELKKKEEEERKKREEEERRAKEEAERKKREEEEKKRAPKFEIQNGVLTGYSGSERDIVIPDGVTTIGEDALKDNNFVKSIVIPEGVKAIGDWAFAACGNLESVALPKSLVTIGSYAFGGCEALKSVLIPANVKTIEYMAFTNCTSLTGVAIPKGVTKIEEGAFSHCPSIGRFTVEKGNADYSDEGNCIVEKSTGLLIAGCNSSVIPDKVKAIGEGAFEQCTLGSVKLPQGLERIGSRAFAGCKGLKALDIPESVAKIDGDAFTEAALGAVSIPDKWKSRLKTEGTGIFGSGYKKIKFTYREDPAVIARRAKEEEEQRRNAYLAQFEIKGGVLTKYKGTDTAVVLPDTVTKIGAAAFKKCGKMTSITIPAGVTSVEGDAFSDCKGLKEVNITDLAAWCAIEFGTANSNPLSLAHHLILNGKELTELVIPSRIEDIKAFSFAGCSGLTGVTFHDDVTSVGEGAFARCSGLKGKLELPDGITSIGKDAFSECSGLTGVTLPVGITQIEEGVFYRCSGLTGELELPGGIVSIGLEAFAECSGLTGKLVLPNSITELGVSAFEGCSGLTGEVRLPNGITEIFGSTFKNCARITSVFLPKSVTSIYLNAFEGCDRLERIDITDLDAWFKISFDENPFGMDWHLYLNGEEVTAMVFPEKIDKIKEYAMCGCVGLAGELKIPSSVTRIEKSAFEGCSITSAFIPKNVTYLDFGIFEACENLTQLTLPFVGSGFDDEEDEENEEGEETIEELTYFGWIFGATDAEENEDFVPPSLKEVILTNCSSIAADAFYNCKDIEEIVLPDDLTEIGQDAFNGCESLKEIEIPSGVNTIGDGAFFGCTSLKNVVIPKKFKGFLGAGLKKIFGDEYKHIAFTFID